MLSQVDLRLTQATTVWAVRLTANQVTALTTPLNAVDDWRGEKRCAEPNACFGIDSSLSCKNRDGSLVPNADGHDLEDLTFVVST